MPHGDFSDYAAFFCLGTGVTAIAAPNYFFTELGPIKPFFDGEATAQSLALLKFAGGLLIFMGIVLFVNRWNTLNGKAGGLGCLVAAINSAHIAWTMDGEKFVPRGWYAFSAIFLIAFLHLSFNANPIHTWQSLKEKEDNKKKK
jgi:hypothetical protein